VREGNRVRPLIDGEPAFRRICAAIDEAQRSVWVTVAFLWDQFEMPDGRGRVFDVLACAAARGVDVRLVCWRPDGPTESFKQNAFWGSADHLALLASYGEGFSVRWDRAASGYCQHQKSWVIDAGENGATCFVGSANLNPHSVVSPGHLGGEGQNHDVYVELTGPSCVDVQHNFVQRWNEASERSIDGGRWGVAGDAPLPLPTTVPAPCGNAFVQAQRTMPNGERSNLEQYLAAIEAARRSIYLQNQEISVAEVLDALVRAARRGVEIVAVIPAECALAREALRGYDNLTLARIVGRAADGRITPVHVHAKLMLVDDVWATVGSCNLHAASLYGNAELNVAFADPPAVRELRVELCAEHLNEDGLTA
jgi:cardiolipin synthase